MNNSLVTTKNFLAVALALLALIGQVGFWSAQDSDGKKPKGKLVAPKEGSTVGREFEVRAQVSNLAKGYKLVACVEVNQLLWPKEPYLEQFKPDGDWTARVAEGGEPGAGFRVSVLVVPPGEGLRKLRDWFQTGNSSGQFPGLKLDDVDGAYRLDSVKVNFR